MSVYASGAATKVVSVTPSDETVLNATRALYVGVAGNVAVVTDAGDSVTFVGVPAGGLLPISVTKVMSTSTTATNILALY